MASRSYPDPPRFVKRFWRSPAGKKLVRVLEPGRWWFIFFGFALIAMIVWTLTIFRTSARDEAAHASAITANAASQYHACVATIHVNTKTNAFVAGQLAITDVLVQNSILSLAATPRGTALYLLRAGNLKRLQAARKASLSVAFPVPTRAECQALRAKLLAED